LDWSIIFNYFESSNLASGTESYILLSSNDLDNMVRTQFVTEAITIPNNFNGMLIGPVNLNANVTVVGNATLVII
jgi:hypothetical protein